MRRQSKRQRDEVQIDMTPMLDIVFIMLIFFIVTTSFVREAGLEVHRPQASQAKAQKSSSIMLAIGARGRSSSTASRSTWSGCRPASPACWRNSPMPAW